MIHKDVMLNESQRDDLLNNALDYADAYFGRPLNLELLEYESVTKGVTRDEFGHVSSISIGAKELVSADSIRQSDVITFIVSLMHEVAGHGQQVEKQFHNTDVLSKVLSLNHFACKSSEIYYSASYKRSYLCQPREIAAQYAGISVGYDFLQKYYTPEMANDLICGYVNDRVRHHSEFVRHGFLKKYVQISDVLDDFERTFADRLYSHRLLNRSLAIRDFSAYADYFRQNPDSIHQMYISMCQNGVKQDLMLSSIYFYQEDMNDRYRSIYKSLEDVPYSPAAAMDPDYYPAWIQHQDKDLKLSQLLTIDDQDKEPTENELSF